MGDRAEMVWMTKERVQLLGLFVGLFVFFFAIFSFLPQETDSGTILIDDFNHGYGNAFGGKTEIYQSAPSVIQGSLVDSPRRGETGNALRLRYVKEEEGWCGYYSIFNEDEYVDASDMNVLSFWIKGEEGGEIINVGLADQKWEEKEDSVKSKPILEYLKNGVTTDWQKVIIPLADFLFLQTGKIASISINFPIPGQGVVYIDDLQFEFIKGKSGIPLRTLTKEPSPGKGLPEKNSSEVSSSEEMTAETPTPEETSSASESVSPDAQSSETSSSNTSSSDQTVPSAADTNEE